MKAIIALIAVFIFLFYSPFVKSVFAGDIVINEFLVDPDADQWVELYNNGTSTIDIGGWFIDDDGGTQKFTIPSGTTINPSEFKVFESGSFNLDWASGDTAKLLNGASVEDSYSYDAGPGTNKSYGRDTDGTGNWVIFNSPTKGSSNNTSSPEPTATPTPVPTNTPTPTPTPIPTSAATATPTKTPTPIKTPTPTKSPTSTPSRTPTPTLKPSASIALGLTATSSSPILGESTQSALIISPTNATNKKNVLVTNKSKAPNNNFQRTLIAIVIGLILLSACGILIFRYRKHSALMI